MTDKERLDWLISIPLDTSSTGSRQVILYEEERNWLIGQAKRGQLMEQYRFESELHKDLYEQVIAANKKLGVALMFYSDRENYINGHHDLMGELPSRTQMDEGALAREVLGEVE